MSRNPCRPGASGATAVAGRKPQTKNVQSSIPKRGPPPASPKKVDYKKPGMTKAMQQRLKHTQKLQEELDRKERERAQAAQCRRPQRTAAPVGGDPRMGRERRARPPGAAPPPARSRPASAGKGPAACSTAAPPSAPSCPPAARKAPAKRATSAPGAKPPAKKPPQQQPPRQAAREPSPPPAAPVPERTRNLAESMNADIVQAEPLQPGMVDNIIIPPGAINSEKTTIVSIPQPDGSGPSTIQHSTIAAGSGGSPGGAANKSMQVINEALDEQDANESAIVNSKLQDLQNARRDFVMAVANVGGNSINLGDADDFSNVTPIMDISPPEMMMSGSEPGSPCLLPCLDEDEPFMPMEYSSRHQPVVESAREYLSSRQQSYRQPVDELDLLDPEYLEGCGLVGTDDCDNQLPVCGPNDNYTVIPRRREQYQYQSFQPEQLEKFFDLENYPPCPIQRPTCPPPGREQLNPDLWELDDPWYREPEPEGPDLIDWNSYC